MALTDDRLRILLIRSWVEPLAPLRDALRAAGIDARFIRADVEPAVNAALWRRVDIIVYDPRVETVSMEEVETALRNHGRDLPIVVLTRLDQLAAAIRASLERTRS